MAPATLPHATVRLFVKSRTARWQNENVAANPQEEWRTRPRRATAQPLQSFALNDAPLLFLASLTQRSAVSSAPAQGLFCLPALQGKTGCVGSWMTPRVYNWVNLATHSLGRWAVAKLKYKGKSFRWHRRRRSLVLRFGHSHLVMRTPLPWIRTRKHGRMKIIFWGTNAWYLRHFLQATIKWRPMNIYHGRGLRLTRQKVPRKAGKVSAYR